MIQRLSNFIQSILKVSKKLFNYVFFFFFMWQSYFAPIKIECLFLILRNNLVKKMFTIFLSRHKIFSLNSLLYFYQQNFEHRSKTESLLKFIFLKQFICSLRKLFFYL